MPGHDNRKATVNMVVRMNISFDDKIINLKSSHICGSEKIKTL